MVKIQSQIRDLVVKQMLSGLRQADVARNLNLGKTTVRYIWQKYIKTGDVSDAKRSGRPMKTTIRERRFLCRISKKNPFLTAREVLNQANLLGKVSVCTVKRYLCKNNLHGRVASKKPLLNSVQIKKELDGVRRIHYSQPQTGVRSFFLTNVEWKGIPVVGNLFGDPLMTDLNLGM